MCTVPFRPNQAVTRSQPLVALPSGVGYCYSLETREWEVGSGKWEVGQWGDGGMVVLGTPAAGDVTRELG